MKNCKELDCNRAYYAKGQCKYHYQKGRANFKYSYQGDICQAPDCETVVSTKYKHCNKHRRKLARGLSLDRLHYPKGAKNYMWKGGVAQYPDHYSMKMKRKQKLIETDSSCEDCGESPKMLHMHHIDLSKDNHKYENFKLLCPKCHYSYHDMPGRPKKI